ncbi:MAG: dimethylglycine dehydrogenase, partial [Gammaproteobacteria bacterium]|nr:dimethylglycine dehydrogenase [Gammaproteobacteria bacterium]
DYSSERTPIEAGVATLVKLDGRTFSGRDALLTHATRARRKRMVLLDIDGDGPDPYYLHPVQADGNTVGIVTSGAYGHRTKKKLALAYVNAEISESVPLSVEIIGNRCPATVLEKPPYDPDNLRLRHPHSSRE